MFSIVDREPQLVEAADAKPLVLKRGQIEFDNVSFAYEPKTLVLKGVSLTVPSGRTVALVGPSGSGKSTLVNLTLRFFDPEKGKVVIDGQDLRDLTLASLRAQVGVVSQDVVLFDDTVRANIAFGRPGAMKTSSPLPKAAAAHDFITAKGAQGYATSAGDSRVAQLSGGERQRIAVARAVLRRADPGARRGDQRTGRRNRDAGQERARPVDEEPHHPGHRPPLDRSARPT